MTIKVTHWMSYQSISHDKQQSVTTRMLGSFHRRLVDGRIERHLPNMDAKDADT